MGLSGFVYLHQAHKALQLKKSSAKHFVGGSDLCSFLYSPSLVGELQLISSSNTKCICSGTTWSVCPKLPPQCVLQKALCFFFFFNYYLFVLYFFPFISLFNLSAISTSSSPALALIRSSSDSFHLGTKWAADLQHLRGSEQKLPHVQSHP